MLIRIHLTEAQRSALECAGLELEPLTIAEAMLKRAWEGTSLVFDERARDDIAHAVNELSNAEDAHYQATRDPFARRAAATLATLYSKVLRAS